MPATASRLSHFTESVIRAMTRLSNQHGAINLSQGFPDFDPPEPVLAALERATRWPLLRAECEREAPVPLRQRRIYAPATFLTYA